MKHPSILHRFLASEAAGGILLMAAAALALVVANSPWGPAYFLALDTYIGPLSLLHWINDAAMAVFFACFGPIASNSTTLALEPHASGAGSAAAALGFMQTVVPAVIASGVAALYDGTAVPMFASMLVLSALGGAIAARWRGAERRRL